MLYHDRDADRHVRPPLLPGRFHRWWLAFAGLLCLASLAGIVTRPDAHPVALSSAGPTPVPTRLALTEAQLMAGPVDPRLLGFDPDKLLTDFDSGQVTRLPSGQIQRRYTIVARDKRLELAPGIFFDAWTYNDRVPGPTLRATEGDQVQVTFVNAGSQPHSIHFHGIHPADQDGLEPVDPGAQRIYTFTAGPAGLQLYHCHIEPLDEHIDRGLYGAFIIDPRTPRPPAHELVMVMNAFDLNGDGENDIYAVNSVPFAYYHHPIPLVVGERVRIYLVNMTGIDPINSFHLHANFFWLFRTGTRAQPDEYTDTVMLSQGERHILEFTYNTPGDYMFHAHQAEFSAKGWMGCFAVHAADGTAPPAGGCTASPMVHATAP
ncbi:MAG TPA: multicopper oxidase domain-containing protein [Chloroflexia bacterium]|nr:multicopper oxidase domain-containing protein [Chloroflexia bacterium]